MSKNFVVYKITRDDGLEYIGKSQNIKNRICVHRKTERFKDHQFSFEILFESTDHNKILDMEEYYIKHFDTFNKGLNESRNGRGNHNSKNFTTLGMKYSEESKAKIKANHWSKKGIRPANLGKSHSEETRQKMSKDRKGKSSHSKLSLTEIEAILMLYKSRPILTYGYVGQNGKLLSYDRAFSNKFATQFNLTSTGLFNIITDKYLYARILYEKIINGN